MYFEVWYNGDLYIYILRRMGVGVVCGERVLFNKKKLFLVGKTHVITTQILKKIKSRFLDMLEAQFKKKTFF